jgi:hypothetical protein
MADAAEAKQVSGPDYGAMMEMGRKAFDQWTRAVFDYGDELGRFAVTRLHDRMKACHDLANCHNVGDAITCEWNFLQKAWADYAEQAARQFQFSTTLAEDVLAVGPAMATTVRPPQEEKPWTVAPSTAAPGIEHRVSVRGKKASASQAAAR